MRHLCDPWHSESLSASNAYNRLLKEATAPRSRLVWMLRRETNCPCPRASCYRWCWYAFFRYYLHLPFASLLKIVVDTGAQPIVYEDRGLALAVNGEIYNYISLKETLDPGSKFKTHSDCEVILHLVSLQEYFRAPEVRLIRIYDSTKRWGQRICADLWMECFPLSCLMNPLRRLE